MAVLCVLWEFMGMVMSSLHCGGFPKRFHKICITLCIIHGTWASSSVGKAAPTTVIVFVFSLHLGRRMFSADNTGLINVWKTSVNESRHQPCHRWCIEKVQQMTFVMSTIYEHAYITQYPVNYKHTCWPLTENWRERSQRYSHQQASAPSKWAVPAHPCQRQCPEDDGFENVKFT